jgi:ABC-type transport system substrate-binding protein
VPTAFPTPRQGGTLRFGNVGDFQNLEGQAGHPDGSSDQLFSVWDRLIVIDANQQPQPMLAESWEIADNYQQIKINLRHGVQFHTGRELTADDVKWSLQRIQDPKIGSNYTGWEAPLTGVETPDRYTVVVNASRPWVEAFGLFEYANIIDPVTFQSDGMSKPTGTGPFMFAEYVQGDHLRLIKNTNYWNSGLPYLGEVLVSIHADAQAAVVALEAGVLDLISFGMPIPDIFRLQQDPTYQVLLNNNAGGNWAAFLNCTRAPTDNKLVRQALNYALNRQRIADAIWRGLEKPVVLPWSPTSPAYDSVKNGAYAFDLDKARALLAQAATTNTELEIVWPTGTPEYATVAQIYQTDLVQLGFEVTLKPLEAAAAGALSTTLDYTGVRLGVASFGNLHPALIMNGSAFGPAHNLSGFKDDAYTQLVDQVSTQTDLSKLPVLYSQLNDYLLEQSFTLPILPNPNHAVASAKVRGLQYDARPYLVLSEVWLAS